MLLIWVRGGRVAREGSVFFSAQKIPLYLVNCVKISSKLVAKFDKRRNKINLFTKNGQLFVDISAVSLLFACSLRLARNIFTGIYNSQPG